MTTFDGMYAGVGRVAAAYGGVEIAVREVLTALLGGTPAAVITAQTLTTEIAINVSGRIIADQARGRPQAEFAKWILNMTRKAGTKRADIAHGAWHMEQHPPSSEWLAARTPTRTRDGSLVLSVSDLAAVATTLEDVEVLLINLPSMLAEGRLEPTGLLRRCHDNICDAWGIAPLSIWT